MEPQQRRRLRRQRERQNNNRFFIWKTTTLHVHQAFLNISLPSLHDHDVKLSNFTFCGGQEQKTTISYSFILKKEKNLDTVF